MSPSSRNKVIVLVALVLCALTVTGLYARWKWNASRRHAGDFFAKARTPAAGATAPAQIKEDTAAPMTEAQKYRDLIRSRVKSVAKPQPRVPEPQPRVKKAKIPPPAPPPAASPPSSRPRLDPKPVTRPLDRLRKTYAPLLAFYDFTEEDETAFLSLLERKTSARSRRGPAAHSAGSGGEAEDAPDPDQDLREFLGVELYAAYALFEKKQPDRKKLAAFNRALGKIDMPLDPDQAAALLDILYEERTRTPDSGEESGTGEDEEEKPSLLPLGQRVQDRAVEILSDDQLEVLMKIVK